MVVVVVVVVIIFLIARKLRNIFNFTTGLKNFKYFVIFKYFVFCT